MELGQDQLDHMCRTFNLPVSTVKMISAVRIKNFIDKTQAEIDRLENDISCRANPQSSTRLKSEHLSVGTHESGNHAARDSMSSHIFARSNEPYVTHRRKPASGRHQFDDTPQSAHNADYDIHFSSTILPPLDYRDEPVDSSLDDLLLSSIILDSSLSDKTHTLSPGHAKMKAKSSSQSTKHEQMIDRLELDIIACNKQPPDRYSTCMYELDVASLPIQPSTQVTDSACMSLHTDAPIKPVSPPPKHEPSFSSYRPTQVGQTTPSYTASSDTIARSTDVVLPHQVYSNASSAVAPVNTLPHDTIMTGDCRHLRHSMPGISNTLQGGMNITADNISHTFCSSQQQGIGQTTVGTVPTQAMNRLSTGGVNNTATGLYSHTALTDTFMPTAQSAPSTSADNLRSKREVRVFDRSDSQANDPMTIAYAIRATREPDVAVFKGDPLQYIEWNKSFTRQVDRNVTYNDDDKLDYLKKFTGGEVSSIVSSFSSLDGDIAYDKVRAIIHERYGHPHILYKAYLSKLQSWKKIPQSDSVSLQRFSDFLIALRTAMVSIPSLSCLNHQILNDDMKELLPVWLKRKWNDRAIQYSKDHDNQFPPFELFAEFVLNFATKANHPIARSEASAPVSGGSTGTKGRVMAIQSSTSDELQEDVSVNAAGTCLSVQPTSQSTSGSGPKQQTKDKDSVKKSSPCLLCKKDHRLYLCQDFSKMSSKDRHSFVKNNRLCALCLNAHGDKKCSFKSLFCKGCNERTNNHNSLLHDAMVGQGPQGSKPKTSNTGQLCGLSACHTVSDSDNTLSCHLSSNTSMIVPVLVSHKQNPNDEVLTYAMLDSQSVFTFITDELANKVAKPHSSTVIGLSTMTSLNEKVRCNLYSDLVVRGFNQSEKVSLRLPHGCKSIPSDLQVPTQVDLVKWPHLVQVSSEFPPVLDVDVGLLIGHDSHYASFPEQSVPAPREVKEEAPYAVKTPLGWTLVGPIDPSRCTNKPRVTFSHKIACSLEVPIPLRVSGKVGSTLSSVYALETPTSQLEDQAVPMDVVKQLESGFNMPGDSDLTVSSIDDTQFMDILSSGIHQDSDGFYSMPLPFRGKVTPSVPNNRAQAISRLKALSPKFRDQVVFDKYNKFMQDMVLKGDAEVVPRDELRKPNIWYLPHHNVVNPKKPEKVRVVFDASSVYQGVSLNNLLLSGPDLNNTLIGVLTRFRERYVAVSCDIESMFYRFKVDENHRDFLRFLWYDSDGNIQEYRMTKHIFGASSSPGCAKFGLLKIAQDYAPAKSLAQWFIEHCFYVDDGLYSCDTVEEAASLLQDTSSICGLGNLKLHKIMSNSPKVLEIFPDHELSHSVTLFEGGAPFMERALGVEWAPASDSFSFSSVKLFSADKVSRRGMLKLIASHFDPLGFIAPIILTGKLLLQRVCHGLDWDEEVPKDIQDSWKAWVEDLANLCQIKVPRCLKPADFGLNISRAEVHTYTDASEKGYGVCVYLRLLNDSGAASSRLLFGKARVVPLKGCTIPRLELQAAVVGAKVSSQLSNELSVTTHGQYFWTDSQIVLAYIQNTKKKLKAYVKNRVALIHELTKVDFWNYIPTQENPADLASRGCSVGHIVESTWFQGPPMLTSGTDMSSVTRTGFSIPDGDPEVRSEKVICNTVTTRQSPLLDALERLNSWSQAIKVASVVKHIIDSRKFEKYCGSVCKLQTGEDFLIQQTQTLHYSAEVDALKHGKPLPSNSPILRFDPFLDGSGLLRVGGRLKAAVIPELQKHPVIIPKKCLISDLIVRHYHEKTAHQGRGMTMSAVRSAGYWVVNLNSAVSSLIHRCVTCSKLRRLPAVQKMSALPAERVNPSPPFSYVGIDYFGPFEVKDGRKYLKRYGVIFTCLYSRAVHVEVCDDLSTDSFINCLRTFIAIRGKVRTIFCDRGTNLVGAFNELKANLKSVDNVQFQRFLEDNHCDFLFNSPGASHMGGAWERLIRTIRNVLNGLCTRIHSLDCSSIRTLFYEVMNIVNSRPLTEIEPDGSEPLTPNHLIQLKSSLVLPPPPGNFSDDGYSRKRWRRVQYLADDFWQRWKPHYLSNLQVRQRWHREASFSVDDIVLLKEDSAFRGDWKLCRIAELITSRDGLVRRVKLQIGDRSSGKDVKHSYLERPIAKVVMLIPKAQQF